MDRVRRILAQVKSLNENELRRISESLLKMLGHTHGVYGVSVTQIENCRKCGGDRLVKFGKDKNGKQRYKCKCCGATFTETSFSVVSRTRHSADVWEKYIKLLLIGASLEECAYRCGIRSRTAFIWRHKILNALQKDQNNRILAGIVEADEMFIPVSYKGNHKHSKRFVMPRAPFKRGSDNRSNKVPKACIMCAVERNGQSYGEVIGKGQPTPKMIEYAFENRIMPDSVVLADGAYAINKYFGEKTDVGLIRLQSTADGSRHSKIPEIRGIYHIQTVNNFHNRLNRFLRCYNGVSTKYLNHYVGLFVWIENHKAMETKLEVSLMADISKISTYIPAGSLFDRAAVPCIA